MDIITLPLNLLTTSGLSILLHGVISLSDVTSYDKYYFPNLAVGRPSGLPWYLAHGKEIG